MDVSPLSMNAFLIKIQRQTIWIVEKMYMAMRARKIPKLCLCIFLLKTEPRV
jgi:hypothetical protein